MIRVIIVIMLVKFERNQNVFKSYKTSNTKYMIYKDHNQQVFSKITFFTKYAVNPTAV